MWTIGAGFELWVELGGDHARVIRELNNLDEFSVGRGPGDDETIVLECVTIGVVELIAVSVSFGYLGGTVRLLGKTSFFDGTRIGSETHRPPLGTDRFLIFHEVNHLMFGCVVEFFGIGTGKATDIASELDRHNLRSETESEIRDLVRTGILRGEDFPLGSSGTESSRDEDGIDIFQDGFGSFFLDFLGIYPVDNRFHIMRIRCGFDCLTHREIGIFEVIVFPNHGDMNLLRRMFKMMEECFPMGEIRSSHLKSEAFLKLGWEGSLCEIEGHPIDRTHGRRWDDAINRNITEERDLPANLIGYLHISSESDEIGLDPTRPEITD